MNDGPQLLDDYLDGALQPQDQDAFLAWLRADPAHVAAFVRAMHLDRGLREHGDALRIDLTISAAGSARIGRPQRLRNKRGRFLQLLLPLVGAGLAAALLLVLWRPHTSVAQPPSTLPVAQQLPSQSPEVGRFVVAHLIGQAQRLDGAVARSVAVGDVIDFGQGLRTAVGGSVTVRRGDGSEFRLEADSQVRLSGDATLLHLDRGQLEAHVAHQPPERKLRITTPHALLTIIGTRFVVSTSDLGTDLAVTQGHVLLARHDDGSSRDVLTGQQANIMAPAIGAPQLMVSDCVLVELTSGRELARLNDGAVVDLSTMKPGMRLNVIAKTSGTVPGSMRFTLVGPGSNGIDKSGSRNVNTENTPPFEMVYGNSGRAQHEGVWEALAGDYVLVATPFAEGNGRGGAGRPHIIHFRLEGSLRP